MATKQPTPDNSITQAGRTIYLNNRELLAAVRESKAQGQMTKTLAKMLQLLCANYGKKGSFVGYSYNDDMQAYAMLMLVKTWNSFDPDKGSNPFAFFTQCVKNSFIQYLKHEGKHRILRDKLLIEQGLNPSYSFDDGNDSDHRYDSSENMGAPVGDIIKMIDDAFIADPDAGSVAVVAVPTDADAETDTDDTLPL